MTAMRSQTAAASSRSWVTNIMARPALAPLLVEDRHDLGLGGHVERGRRLVGQQQPRLDRQGRGDHHPLQQAARQLVRVLAQAAGGVVDPDVLQQMRPRAARRLLASAHAVGDQRLGEEVADRAHRVHVRARVLEDHRDVGGPVAPQGVATHGQHGRALEERSRRSPRARAAAGGSPPATSSTCRRPTRRPARRASPSATASVTSWITGCMARRCDRQARCAGRGSRAATLIAARPSRSTTASRSPSRLKATTVNTIIRPA